MKNDGLLAFLKSLKFYHLLWLAVWLVAVFIISLVSVIAGFVVSAGFVVVTCLGFWAFSMKCMGPCESRFWPIGESSLTHCCFSCMEQERHSRSIDTSRAVFADIRRVPRVKRVMQKPPLEEPKHGSIELTRPALMGK